MTNFYSNIVFLCFALSTSKEFFIVIKWQRVCRLIAIPRKTRRKKGKVTNSSSLNYTVTLFYNFLLIFCSCCSVCAVENCAFIYHYNAFIKNQILKMYIKKYTRIINLLLLLQVLNYRRWLFW